MILKEDEFRRRLKDKGMKMSDLNCLTYPFQRTVGRGKVRLETARKLAELLDCNIIDIVTDEYLEHRNNRKRA